MFSFHACFLRVVPIRNSSDLEQLYDRTKAKIDKTRSSMAAKKAEAEMAARMLKAKEEGLAGDEDDAAAATGGSEAKKRRREDMGEGEKKEFDIWINEIREKR